MISTIIEIFFIGITVLLASWKNVFFILYLVPLSIEIYKDGKSDEMITHFRRFSGYISFLFLITVLTLFGIFGESLKKEEVNLLIFLSFVLKNLISLHEYMDRWKLLCWEGNILGLSILAFSLVSHGLSTEFFIESPLGIFILIATFLGKRHKLASFLMFSGISVLFLFMIIRRILEGVGFKSGVIFSIFALVFLPGYFAYQTIRKEE